MKEEEGIIKTTNIMESNDNDGDLPTDKLL